MMFPPSPSRLYRHAFTLLELAVVLVIVGLLVGGLMMGSSVLRQSQMQTIISDYSKYNTAVAQFNQQYGSLPGDIIDATNYWGDDSTACADAAVTDGSPGTCNGNGNGDMSNVGAGEPYRAWQHLSLANLVSGSYSGVASGLGSNPGVNCPKSTISNAGWSFGYKGALSADTYNYDQALGNALVIGAASGAMTKNATFTPSEAWQIDTKADDGLPATGRVMTWKDATLANCILNPDAPTDTNDSNDSYNRAHTKKACALYMGLTTK